MSRLPAVGGDDNTWGNVLNDFLSVEHNTDGTLKTVAVNKGGTGATDAATARGNLGAAAASDLAAKADDAAVVHLSGDTMSGNLTVGNSSAAGVIAVDGPDNQFKWIEWHSAGVKRFGMDLDTGANWGLNRYDTSGNFQQTVLVGLVGGGLQVLPNGAGAVTIRAAQDDTKLFNSSVQFYLDEPNNNLKIRVQYSDGTLKTGTIPLA